MRAAFKEDSQSAAAAYNLAVLVGRDRPDDAAVLSHRASDLEPASAKYAFTWAFYLAQSGEKRTATAVLRRALDRGVASSEINHLLGRLATSAGQQPRR